MPRKAFVHDLQQSIQDFSHCRVSDVAPGVEDGSVTFTYTYQPAGVAIVIQALVTDVGDYPSSHMYMVYTTSDNIPAHLSTALEDVGTLDGCNVGHMLSKVAKTLDQADAGSETNPLNLDDDDMDADDHIVDGSDPEIDDDSDVGSEEIWSPGSPSHNHITRSDPRKSSELRGRVATLASNRRIRSDLKAVKQAGFRVGHLGGLIDNAQDCFVTVSIRVSKLGISEEAMHAWHLSPSQYFLLLIRYTAGYRSLDDLIASGSFHRSQVVVFRVGLSQHYKIPLDEAVQAFSQLRKKYGSSGGRESSESKDRNETSGTGTSKGLQPLFIGSPLQDLMNERLLAMINYRSAMGFGWAGAESYYIDHQGSNLLSENIVDNKYYAPESSSRAAALPKLVTNDHLAAAVTKASFPLIAMQFALRHLVRCTEFCLVCHEKVETGFEALKPYVCSKPLCLYQYMAFGFGPSIEHDIIAQPHVVDLLISFCYSSAAFGTLKNLPTGLALAVPNPSVMPARSQNPYWKSSFPHALNETAAVNVKSSSPPKLYKAKLDQANMELILSSGETVLFPNQWIFVMMTCGTVQQRFHCRVVEALYPTIRLGPPVRASDVVEPPESKPQPQTSAANPRAPGNSLLDPARLPVTTLPSSEATRTAKYPEVEFIIYDQNFDDLSFADKQCATCMLLETLPAVLDMKRYLQSKSGKDMRLKEWQDCISPAAAGVLRWIIASNRSCIVEVDHLTDGNIHASEERVTGMPEWMQFRFAQGAPDKEKRFIQSIRDVTSQQQYPSLYAWHGSPLQNWHSIVREGLHFQDTAHGRAYGHGVYHATDVLTSIGYTGGHYHHVDGSSPASSGGWPQSHLKISQAVALNEIVNAPQQFVSQSPHLVVAQLDWIQTRYLFVKINNATTFDKDVRPKEIYAQDPNYTPMGSDRQKIVIPITAVSKSRRPLTTEAKNGVKKMKTGNIVETDDCVLLSDDTDVEDLQILIDDEEGPENKTSVPAKSSHHSHATKDKVKPKPLETPKTDFVPGILDPTSLPLLEPPSFATPMATKALQRELNSTLKIQESLPAHELGWYINRELLNNMYQWIVELHSFESHLPLAQDLKAKDLKSVVLEVRFGKDYPMSPPFVRIIRPRFLSFMAGGGGHVTAGGALCMELLTNSGWSAVSNMESVLLQVRLAMSSTDPKPARLEPGKVRDYGVGEAIEAYIRACNAHGWTVPPDFQSNYAVADNRYDRPLPIAPV
ncbi:MAG: hypothetical protein L6R36_005687 [Xanthoria steineri]|nr:MAG: hypothetical protein L6R36_005687 [Xanthoria steineri]